VKDCWRRPWFWAAVAIAVVFFGNSGFRQLVSRGWELRKLRRELAQLKTEQAGLERRIQTAHSAGPELEQAARRELDYLKPGEIEYRFPPPSKEKK